MRYSISLIALSLVFGCAPAPPTEGARSPATPAGSSSSLPISVPTSTPEVASQSSTSANTETAVPLVRPEPAQEPPTAVVPEQAPPTEVVPAPESVAMDVSPFEPGLDEILDARPIRLTKRSPEAIKADAERLAANAKALAPKTKGKGKAHAGAAAAHEELAYALRRELAKPLVTAELATDLRARRTAAEDAALAHYFEAITADNTLDEAKYRAAHLLHARRNVVNARKQYFVLVENHPNSAFVPLAFLGFALLFADEARGDKSKWPFVEMSGMKALEPEGNPATPEALLLIARAQRGSGKISDFTETLGKLRKGFPRSAAAKRKL